MQLKIYNPDGEIGANTTLTLNSFSQMTSISSTAFSRIGPDGDIESMCAPLDVLPIIIQRNAARFNQDLLKHIPEGTQYLDPLREGPDKVVDDLIEQFHGRYHKIHFSLSEFVAGWARQFGERGYSAIRKLCEAMRASRPQNINPETATLDELFESIGKQISLSALLQRFLEGDEERYFYEVLKITPDVCHNRSAIFAALQKYLATDPSEHEKEVLWMVIRALRNGGIVSPDPSHILVDFIDSVSDKNFSEAFRIIASSTLGEVLAIEEVLINDKVNNLWVQAGVQGFSHEKLADKRIPTINNAIKSIIGCLESGEDTSTHLSGLSLHEQEIIFCSLRTIWMKSGPKRRKLNELGTQLLATAISTKTILSPETTKYLLHILACEDIGVAYCHFVFGTLDQKDVDAYVDYIFSGLCTDKQRRKISQEIFLPLLHKRGVIGVRLLAHVWNYCHDASIEPYIRTLDPANFVELFWCTNNRSQREKLMILGKGQIAQIFQEVRAGNIQPYAHFIHQIITPGKKHAFDTLFGISNLFLSKKHGVTPLLPAPKPTGIIQTIQGKIIHALASVTRQYERIIQTSIRNAQKFRESLLYSFGEGYFPIGGKIHFSKPLSADKVTLLHQVVGFSSTTFQLLHANESLNLPPCQSPIQLMAILYQLAHLGIVTDDELQLQLSVAGRVPNMFAGILASACIFAKPHKKEYKPEAFLTSHNDLTATCICCYDAGQLEKEGFPNILPHIQGRIDMLGFSKILEVLTYFLLGNLISQSCFGGKFQKIGQSFMADYIELLQKHGMANILDKKWVHTPGSKRLPAEEEEHYQTVKLCTDILNGDIDNYLLRHDAGGFSFQVKQLIHTYIVRHNLLPLEELWAQNYIRYLNYQQPTLMNKYEKILQ